MTSANELLFSGGLPSLSFKDAPIGHSYSFTITRVGEPGQQKGYEDGKPLFWEDGNPKMQVPLDVKLDSGEARGWWVAVGSNQHKALRDAVRQAGGNGIEVGAHVVLTLVAEQPHPKGNKFNGIKIYAVEYTRPSAGNSALMGGAPAAPAAPQAPAQPAAPQGGQVNDAAMAAALAALTPEQRALIEGGLGGKPVQDTPPF